MAGITNHDRVGKTLDILKRGLMPYIVQELAATPGMGDKWRTAFLEISTDDKNVTKQLANNEPVDVHLQLRVMWDAWNNIFRKTLGHSERSLVSELRDFRNKWAHQEQFSTDDAYRAMDSAERLLTAISAPQAQEIAGEKQRLMRERYEQQTRDVRKKTKDLLQLEGKPTESLKPWREIITPHPDVASGNYQQAEFAADLSQVHRGEGAVEYLDPREFFRRTYLTEGLRMLLTTGLKRICGKNGDPVVELQTNFGGGKTHSMLALYHMFSGEPATSLPGVESLTRQESIEKLEAVPRAVLVGTALSPAQPQTKDDGTIVKTLWGELAHQLLGRDGYEMIKEADERGISPGSDGLRAIFKKTGPCLVLIDEWVAYVRQLHGKSELSGGTFEANITFAQSLTEAARSSEGVLLVASIPASKIEIGGDGGALALDQLKHTFGRMESPWRPASAEESFEIVRRRLFENISDSSLYATRDGVIDAFCDIYRKQSQEFPSECKEGEYNRRMKACYPIHPELFDRLYNEWSSLDKFQRTRGVLRLMASVIHYLWENNDASLMIMPCSVPIHFPTVQSELTRYLEDQWAPVIERDIDGQNSLPLRIDRENPNMGRYSACRRVARAIYMASAPTVNTAGRGTDDKHIRLGCIQPGESVATFGDALRRLTDQAVHLYMDNSRYWYSTQPSMLSLAKDRASQFAEDVVFSEIRRRLANEQHRCGDFSRVHACPADSSDVADEYATRLVILGPGYAHQKGQDSTDARARALEILNNRGNSPRQYRNALAFLAPDERQLQSLIEAIRQFLAWKSIEAGKGENDLNLDPAQARQAQEKCSQANETVKQRIPETYIWVLAPYQPDPQGDSLSWNEYKPLGDGSIAERCGNRLKREEALIRELGPTILRMEMDKVPLWRGNHVSVRQLVEDFAKYVYLPRLVSPRVLAMAIADGIAQITWTQDTFAYADSYDDDQSRYRGLKAGQAITVSEDSPGIVVKPDVAAKQLAAEVPTQEGDVALPAGDAPGGTTDDGGQGAPFTLGGDDYASPPDKPEVKRFVGVCELSTTRMATESGTIAQEVVQHLQGLVGADVEIQLEIHAKVPDGVPDNIVRIVSQNCHDLKFTSYSFEEE